MKENVSEKYFITPFNLSNFIVPQNPIPYLHYEINQSNTRQGKFKQFVVNRKASVL